jgi:hypothetical protein
MSTITEAIEKRKKEVGKEEVDELVPLALEDMGVEIPKDHGARRVAMAALVLLLVVGGAFSAIKLFKDLRGNGSTASAGTGSQVASLPGSQEHRIPPGDHFNEETTPSQALPTSAERPAPVEEREQESPLPVKPSPRQAASVPTAAASSGGTPPSSPETVLPGPEVPGDAPELPQEAQPDPFAGISLQGIMRFGPKGPQALINGQLLKVGDSLNGIEVIQIGQENVRLRCGNVEKAIGYK